MKEKMTIFNQEMINDVVKYHIENKRAAIPFRYAKFIDDYISFPDIPDNYAYHFYKCKFKNITITNQVFPDLKHIYDLFYYCDFLNVKFDRINLYKTNFMDCKFINTVFSYCVAVYADFTVGRFKGLTDFKSGNYSYCLFPDSLKNISYSQKAIGIPFVCPQEGCFIGYKKVYYEKFEDGWLVKEPCIVKLLIPEDAKRSSSTTRKCRCSKAKVLSITEKNGKELNIKTVFSYFDKEFTYTVGEIVEVKDFYESRWRECASGIHFYMDRIEAVNHKF